MRLTVNGTEHELVSPPLTPLLHVLRDELEITSPKAGCQQGGCGTCTVLAAAAARVGGSLRVAVSGAGPTAVRCSAVEASGDPADALKDVTPHDDALASVWYRTTLLPVVVRRALAQLEENA